MKKHWHCFINYSQHDLGLSTVTKQGFKAESLVAGEKLVHLDELNACIFFNMDAGAIWWVCWAFMLYVLIMGQFTSWFSICILIYFLHPGTQLKRKKKKIYDIMIQSTNKNTVYTSTALYSLAKNVPLLETFVALTWIHHVWSILICVYSPLQ